MAAHHERSAVSVAKLNGDVEVAQAEFEELGRTEGGDVAGEKQACIRRLSWRRLIPPETTRT